MDTETKIELVAKSPTEEIVTKEDLREIFQTYSHPHHYIGFEISGMVHLGSGLITLLKTKDFQKAGCKTTIWLADYHSWINGKLGGDLESIKKIAKGYFKHAFISMGLENVEYKLASEVYDADYWASVLKISKDTTIKRMLRCTTIMGRKEDENLSCAGIIYPPMQAADIFLLDVQIAHAGMDQRNVHMLAREFSDKFKKKFTAVHHHLLCGLKGGDRMDPLEMKMSKSKPDSAIFIHDSEEEINSKIKKAYCPEKITKGNPVAEIAMYLILRENPLKIERPEKFGGDMEITSKEELEKVYLEGNLHPIDLKNAVAGELSKMLKPSRDYFEKNKNYLEELKDLKMTR
ncbi:MAG: tyrosine--tRNA ligase [Candidatus Micrarchaeia archaeon]